MALSSLFPLFSNDALVQAHSFFTPQSSSLVIYFLLCSYFALPCLVVVVVVVVVYLHYWLYLFGFVSFFIKKVLALFVQSPFSYIGNRNECKLFHYGNQILRLFCAFRGDSDKLPSSYCPLPNSLEKGKIRKQKVFLSSLVFWHTLHLIAWENAAADWTCRIDLGLCCHHRPFVIVLMLTDLFLSVNRCLFACFDPSQQHPLFTKSYVKKCLFE